MILDKSVLVFGQINCKFRLNADLGLSKKAENQHIKDYQFEVSGSCFEIAKSLTKKYQVSIFSELGRDFLSDQIIYHLNKNEIDTSEVRFNQSKANLVICDNFQNHFSFSNSVVSSFRPQQKYDYFVLTDFTNIDSLSEILHLAVNQRSEVIYYMTAKQSKQKLKYLLEDIKLLIIDDQLLIEIAKKDTLDEAVDWLKINANQFLVKSKSKIIGFDGETIYRTGKINNCDFIKPDFLDNYLENNFAKSLLKTIPKDVLIRESRSK